MKTNIFILLCLTLFSCESDVTISKNQQEYFDIKSLLNNQIKTLSEGAKVAKSTYIKGVQQTDTVAIESWENEMKLFLEADICKPALIGMYAVSQQDGATIYESQTAKVRKMSVVENNGETQAISIKYIDQNSLYDNERDMRLEFQDKRLKSYYLKGYQKVVFNDTLYFEVKANVL